jgi:hypothetical protein
VFIRRYFGDEHPPRCGTCDRCRAGHVATPAQERQAGKRRPRNARRRRDRPKIAAKDTRH